MFKFLLMSVDIYVTFVSNLTQTIHFKSELLITSGNQFGYFSVTSSRDRLANYIAIKEPELVWDAAILSWELCVREESAHVNNTNEWMHTYKWFAAFTWWNVFLIGWSIIVLNSTTFVIEIALINRIVVIHIRYIIVANAFLTWDKHIYAGTTDALLCVN